MQLRTRRSSCVICTDWTQVVRFHFVASAFTSGFGCAWIAAIIGRTKLPLGSYATRNGTFVMSSI